MCDCIDKVNEKLKPYNTMLWLPLMLNFPTGKTFVSPRVGVATEKIDTKKRTGRAKAVFASYCPFCGEKYAKDDWGTSAAEGEQECEQTPS